MSLLTEAKNFLELSDQDLKSEIILKLKGNVYFLLLNRKGNTFNKVFIRAINQKLDIVLRHEGPTALVSLSLQKFFSGGIDIKYVADLHSEDWRYYLLYLIALFGRLVAFPVPTFCLVNGAAFAGGCMYAFSNDYIYAAQKCAFRCNEVQMGLYILPGMNAVIKRKLDNHADHRDMLLRGKLFHEQESLQKGIIDGILKQNPIAEIYRKAETLAKYGENKVNFKKLKQETYKDVIDECFNKQIAIGTRGETPPPPLPRM